MKGLPELIAYANAWLPAFVLVLARTTAMTFSAPIFGQRTIPPMGRTSLAVALSIVYMAAAMPKAPPEQNLVAFAFLVIAEVFTGMLFSFSASVIMSAIQAAGEFMDVQMGLSMVTLLNPATRTQSTAIGRLFYQLATIVFLITGSHLLLLGGFFHSFDLIPLGAARWHDAILPNALIATTVKVFTVGVQLAMPLIVVIFVVDFGLGVMNRVSPQINVLEMNNIIKPLTGGFMIMMLLPTLTHLVAVLATEAVNVSNEAMKALAGPPHAVERRMPKGPPPGLKPGTKM